MKRKCRYCIFAVYEVHQSEDIIIVSCPHSAEENYPECFVAEDTCWQQVEQMIKEAKENVE